MYLMMIILVSLNIFTSNPSNSLPHNNEIYFGSPTEITYIGANRCNESFNNNTRTVKCYRF